LDKKKASGEAKVGMLPGLIGPSVQQEGLT